MLKKVVKTFIIALMQLIPLVGIALVLGMILLSNSEKIVHWRDFFIHTRFLFLFMHGLFYLTLYFLWPSFVRILMARQTETVEPERIKIAIDARIYLVVMLILFEFLFYVRS